MRALAVNITKHTVTLFVVVAALTVAGSVACSKSSDESNQTAGARQDDAPPGQPPFPVVTDDAADLLFSFVDAQGRVQPVSKVSDVPDAVKPRVLVVDLKRTPAERQAHKYAFFVDLTTKGPDGTYPVSVVSRYDSARGQTQVPLAPAPEGSVVLYTAAWCGFCKKAKAWLKEHDVAFIERDVEKQPGAQAELDEKLKRANVAGGGIPVIDWAGTVVMGFDPARFEQLRAAMLKK